MTTNNTMLNDIPFQAVDNVIEETNTIYAQNVPMQVMNTNSISDTSAQIAEPAVVS